MHMKTTPGSLDDAALDALLAQAPRHTPAAGFVERVLASLHTEELTAPQPRPWYLRPYSWGSAAAAACLVATCCLLPLLDAFRPLPADSLAVDDALLVEEVLDSIDDADLISAICSVSTGAYSISTGSSVTYP